MLDMNVKGINFAVNDNKKSAFIHKKNNVIEKNIQTSHLNVLDIFGRAHLNMSFKGSLSNNLSDENDKFNLLKQEFDEKIKLLPQKIKDKFDSTKLDENNIELANHILSVPDIYENSKCLGQACGLLRRCDDKYQAEFGKTVLSNPKLYKDRDFMITAFSLINMCDSDNMVDISKDIFFDENLSSDEMIEKYLRSLPDNSNNKSRADIAKRIFENFDIFKNSKFTVSNAVTLINRCKKPVHYELGKTILDNSLLFKDSNYITNALCILNDCDTLEEACVCKAMISNKDFCSDPNVYLWAGCLISECDTNEKAEFAKEIVNSPYLSVKEKQNLWSNCILGSIETPFDVEAGKTIFQNKELCTDSLFMKQPLANFELLQKIPGFTIDNYSQLKKQVDMQKEKVLEHPELYINGDIDDFTEININDFFENFYFKMLLLSATLDKEALNNLLRTRFSNTKKYLSTLSSLNKKDTELISNLAKQNNINDKPFLPAQKIGFIDLIAAYKENNLNTDNMKDMIKNGKVDTSKLNIDLFNGILKNCGFSDEEIAEIPAEKLTAWDIQYVHLLSKEINNSSGNIFNDLLRAANSDDFKSYINDTSNIYGQTNENTKYAFDVNGINYDKWLNPPEYNNVHFISNDENKIQLNQIANQIKNDVNALRNTQAKGFVNKQLSKYIKNDEFIIPFEYQISKAKLTEFTENILKQLDSVFKRAQNNLNNPSKAQFAERTISIKEHLVQKINDITLINNHKSSKNMDLTIKMWDRIPQKDIFQGNYSTCCISMGGGNGCAMPHYLMNTAFNMIEIVDNSSDKTIGNALCYFIKDNNKQPALIIDNIEINNNYKPSDDVATELRNAITLYASNIAKDVTGRDDINIYMGQSYNDVPYQDLYVSKQKADFIGDIDCNETYLDLYGGWISKNKLIKNVSLLCLK